MTAPTENADAGSSSVSFVGGVHNFCTPFSLKLGALVSKHCFFLFFAGGSTKPTCYKCGHAPLYHEIKLDTIVELLAKKAEENAAKEAAPPEVNK